MSVIGVKRSIIHMLRKENVVDCMEEICGLDNFDIQGNLEYKENKFNELVSFSSDNTLYYGNLFSRLNCNLTEPYLSINKIPVLTKTLIRNYHDKLICSRISGAVRSTSGTTGSPLFFQKDKIASSYMDAVMYWAYMWYGILPTDRQARLWGSATDCLGKVVQLAKDSVLSRRRLSAFKIKLSESAKYFCLLKKFKPKYFYCYPSVLYQFALNLEILGMDGRELGIPLAICTGEVLFPHHRQKIERTFGCKVVGEYGSTENGIIGFECEVSNMHVMPTVLVEILNPDQNGYGPIIVTELNSRSIPFVRYENGDFGRLIKGSCECGRPYPLIEVSEGRVDSFIKCPNGSLVYDSVLAYTLKGHVEKFKAYQDGYDCLTIYYVQNESFDCEMQKKIQNKLKVYLGGEMNIIFEKVDKIEPDKSGKLRYFVPLIEP